MLRTRCLHSPVVTILSPSPSTSRRAQEALRGLVGMEPIEVALEASDNLDKAFRSSIPGLSKKWDSVVSECSTSGTILHFCSPQGSEREGPLSVIGVTEGPRESSGVGLIRKVREQLAAAVADQVSEIMLRDSLGMGISPMSVLKSVSSGGLPMLELPQSASDTSNEEKTEVSQGTLKEITIPYFDYASYKDGNTLASKIAASAMSRTVVGVYRWPGTTTHVRPLPTAGEDQRLPPSSLVFQGDSLEGMESKQGVKVSKIGFGGSKMGQYILMHPALEGLDVRLCPQTKISSSFCEAQDSLLAASLDELQSTNTLLAGGEQGKHDEKIGNADCWVEVRANLRSPSGFWSRKAGTGVTKNRIAKIPDIPYE